MIEITRLLDAKKYLAELKAVIFDLDDTLYGEKEYIRSGYHKIAQILPTLDNVEEKLWELFESGEPAIDALLKLEGIDSDEVKHLCLSTYRNQEPDIHLYDGVREMLTELKESGFLLGIITDGRPEGQNAKIRALGLSGIVDEIIVTDELGGIEFRKPNPTAFRLMAEKLHLDFSQMCYIGDNANKDFIASTELGMKSIWFINPDGIYTVKK